MLYAVVFEPNPPSPGDTSLGPWQMMVFRGSDLAYVGTVLV